MTLREANRLARDLWGEQAFAADRRTEMFVGSGCQDARWGEGLTFDEAFVDAAARALELAGGTKC